MPPVTQVTHRFKITPSLHGLILKRCVTRVTARSKRDASDATSMFSSSRAHTRVRAGTRKMRHLRHALIFTARFSDLVVMING